MYWKGVSAWELRLQILRNSMTSRSALTAGCLPTWIIRYEIRIFSNPGRMSGSLCMSNHGFQQALRCRGTAAKTQYGQPEVVRRPFPVAANDRPGIKELWRKYTADSIAKLETAASPHLRTYDGATQIDTLWPDALRLFPDLADRYNKIDPVDSLHRTLKAGIFDEYGWPALEELIQTSDLRSRQTTNIRICSCPILT